jgi:hypothetical protein
MISPSSVVAALGATVVALLMALIATFITFVSQSGRLGCDCRLYDLVKTAPDSGLRRSLVACLRDWKGASTHGDDDSLWHEQTLPMVVARFAAGNFVLAVALQFLRVRVFCRGLYRGGRGLIVALFAADASPGFSSRLSSRRVASRRSRTEAMRRSEAAKLTGFPRDLLRRPNS